MDIDKDFIRQVFELEKTAVNQDRLAENISENLKKRHLKSPTQWPTFALAPNQTNNESFSSSGLIVALDNATQSYDKIWLELSIPASDTSLSARIKRPFHQLVLFYVNNLGQKQIKFNDRLLRIINKLTVSDGSKDAEIRELKEQLAELRNRVQELEKSR